MTVKRTARIITSILERISDQALRYMVLHLRFGTLLIKCCFKKTGRLSILSGMAMFVR